MQRLDQISLKVSLRYKSNYQSVNFSEEKFCTNNKWGTGDRAFFRASILFQRPVWPQHGNQLSQHHSEKENVSFLPVEVLSDILRNMP